MQNANGPSKTVRGLCIL